MNVCARFQDGGGSGRRLISVAVNGTSAISNLDVYVSAGGDLTALIEEVTGTADATGTLTLSFTADLMKMYPVPFINAIEVMSAGVVSNKYDPVGNLVRTTDWTGLTTLTWNGENRLLSVASGLNGTESYQYAADGMRRQKVTSAQTTNFVWDRQNVLQERSQTNLRLSQYTDYPGYWGGLASGRQGTASSFYGFDSQASTRILVSIAGTVTDNYAYSSFGFEIEQGQGPNNLYTNNPYRYGGRFGYYRDSIRVLSIRARELDCMSVRWLTRDPLGFHAGDPNQYRAVLNNPQTMIDPSGLQGYGEPCATLHAQMKAVCNQKRSCMSLGQNRGMACPGRDCAEMGRRLSNGYDCLRRRIAVYEMCHQGVITIDNPITKKEGHILEMAYVAGDAYLCWERLLANGCGPCAPPPIIPYPIPAPHPGQRRIPRLIYSSPPLFGPAPIPAWVLALLAAVGIAGLIALCLSQPELCAILTPIIQRLSAGAPAFELTGS